MNELRARHGVPIERSGVSRKTVKTAGETRGTTGAATDTAPQLSTGLQRAVPGVPINGIHVSWVQDDTGIVNVQTVMLWHPHKVGMSTVQRRPWIVCI